MSPKSLAWYGGWFLLVVGVLALIPSFNGGAQLLPRLNLESSYGEFLGLFPMNILNKVAWIALGLWGLSAASSVGRELPSSILWNRAIFYVMGLAVILGLFRATNTLGGYVPLFGGLVWLNAVLAAVGFYGGYNLTLQVPKDRSPRPPNRESLAH